MTAPQVPTLVRAVVFTDVQGREYAATVSTEPELGSTCIGLHALMPPRISHEPVMAFDNVPHDPEGAPGTWRWPHERNPR